MAVAAALQAEAVPEQQQPPVGALLYPELPVLPNRYRTRYRQPADALLPLPQEAWQPRDLSAALRQWPASREVGRLQSEVPAGVGARFAVEQAEREAWDVDPGRQDWDHPSWKHRDSASPALAGPVRAHPDQLAGLTQAGPQWWRRLAWLDGASPAIARALRSAPKRQELGAKQDLGPDSNPGDALECRAWLPEAEKLAGGVGAGL